MSAAKRSVRGRGKASVPLMSEKKMRVDDELDAELDLSSDIKGIISALQQIREKAQKDGQKKNEETIGCVASEVRAMLDETKSKIEKDRQAFTKALTKNSKECESLLRSEYAKFQASHEKFCKDKTAFLQAFKGKREKAALSEVEKACTSKIIAAEEALKKKKQDDKSFSILRKSLGSFLDNASDDDYGPDD